MSEALFESLGEVHRYDGLEELLDYVAGVVGGYSGFQTALITFYFGDDVFYGAAGCPPGAKERFRKSFHMSGAEKRQRKREVMLQFGRPGTNICFIPAGQGPEPGPAYLRGDDSVGTWDPDDRLVVFLRSWHEDILGMVSLDNPESGNRPDEAVWQRIEEVDRYVNVIAKIAENRFWSLRLQESEAAYRGVFRATGDALVILDPDGSVVEANPAACRLYGYTYEELLQLNVKHLLHPDYHPQCDRFLQRISEGLEFHVEARDVRKDGSAFDAEVRGTSFQYRGRLRLLTVTQDVSEKKRVFQRLLEQQKEESIIAIAGGVAHDFNNLLMGITGSVGLLRGRLPADGEAQRQCERISASADRLAHLTGQLLAIARGVHSEPRLITLAQVVEDNLALVRGLVGGRFGLDVQLPDEPWALEGDRVQLGQVLFNLAQNATEAMERGGGLRIEVLNVRREKGWVDVRTGAHPPGDYVSLVVRDDGHGMPDATQRSMFEPYFSTKATGSGLGLAAVLGIVRRHNGAIELESAPGRGTRIAVLLPRSLAVPEPLEPPLHRPREVGPRRRVLLVEDDPLVRAVTTEMLAALGCAVEGVADGHAALSAYRDHGRRIDLVLLDVTMPGMSGVETSEALLRMDPSARIILTSGHTEHLVRQDLAPTCAIEGFLQKPYSLAGLQRALAQVGEQA